MFNVFNVFSFDNDDIIDDHGPFPKSSKWAIRLRSPSMRRVGDERTPLTWCQTLVWTLGQIQNLLIVILEFLHARVNVQRHCYKLISTNFEYFYPWDSLNTCGFKCFLR